MKQLNVLQLKLVTIIITSHITCTSLKLHVDFSLFKLIKLYEAYYFLVTLLSGNILFNDWSPHISI